MAGSPPVVALPPSRAALPRRTLIAIHVAVLLASFLYAPFCQRGPVVCYVRQLTGLACPSCGLTRSFCAMAHGRFADAAACHPLGPALFAALCASLLLVVFAPVVWRRVALARITHLSLAGVLFAVWVGRLICRSG